MNRRKHSGVALLAALGFLAAMFIVISSVNSSMLFSIGESKRLQRHRQATELSRAVAIQFSRTGQVPQSIHGYECAVEFLEKAATAPATAALSATNFEVLLTSRNGRMRTVWRRTGQSVGKVALVRQGESD